MSQDDVLIGYRLRLFALAEEIGIRAACRTMGVHHSTYYRWKRRVDRRGLEALRVRERRRPACRMSWGRTWSSASSPSRARTRWRPADEHTRSAAGMRHGARTTGRSSPTTPRRGGTPTTARRGAATGAAASASADGLPTLRHRGAEGIRVSNPHSRQAIRPAGVPIAAFSRSRAAPPTRISSLPKWLARWF